MINENKTHNCPECNTPDYYSGVFGGNCVKSNCSLYRGNKSSSVKEMNDYLTNDAGELVTHSGGQKYSISKKYPTIVGSPIETGKWFACHISNKGIGTCYGAMGPFAFAPSFEEAVEEFVSEFGEEE